nr:translation initiation factor IF-2-like isoform X1 [Saimiri boliviensis boliviensis]XP_039329139.1 translation initiation factor IF-2-like isoform X1 [Saimiri boliviensis boliviensis]
MERYIEDMETLVAGPKQVFGTTDTLPRRRPQTAPPHARDSAPLVSNALPGLELRRPSPVPHPRRSLLAWPSPHPHCKLEDHPASPRVAGRRVLISDLRQAGEAALPPVLQPHGPHGTRPARQQNGLAVPASPAPAPPPSPLPLVALSLPPSQTPAPASAGTSGPASPTASSASGLPSRALSQRREPGGAAALLPASPTAAGSRRPPGKGRARLRAFLPSRGLRAPEVRPQGLGRSSGKWTTFAQTVGSTGRGAIPDGTAQEESLPVKPPCNKMVGFGLLYFFFCSLHF